MPDTKCHPSRPIPDSDSEPVLSPSSPHAHLFPSEQYSGANSLKELPITDPSNVFFTTIAVHSIKDNTYHQWEEEDYLQPATYAHNISPISGCENLDPFFLIFDRHALSPDIISLELPPKPISQDHYAHHLVPRLQLAYREFSTIKADLKRYQREFYDSNRAKNIDIPTGKIVCIRKDQTGEKQGATRFIRNFDGPFKVIGHYYDRPDLLKLMDISTQKILKPTNIEKVISTKEPYDLEKISAAQDTLNNILDYHETAFHRPANDELRLIAYEFATYLLTRPEKKAYSSEAFKRVYQKYPPARDVLTRYGRLKGLVSQCPYLELKGAFHGGTYTLHLLEDKFKRAMQI